MINVLIYYLNLPVLFHLDWNDSETDLAHLAGAQPGAAKSGGDKLWEDNWDDDDIEDEFSVQLR
jgi:26 proteasome complex subunit DSS1